MRWIGYFVLGLGLIGCTRADIAKEYPAEVTALATQGGTGLPFLVGKDLRPVWDTRQSPEIRTLLPFHLTDQKGKAITRESLGDRITIVSFFFTQCPGICPTMVKNLKPLQKKFKDDKRFLILSLSVTPEHDTPKTLAAYGDKMGVRYDNWRLLTGGREQIYQLARESFGADTFSIKENLIIPLKPQDFLHSEGIYLLDREKRLRGIYEGLVPGSIEELARDAESLLT